MTDRSQQLCQVQVATGVHALATVAFLEMIPYVPSAIRILHYFCGGLIPDCHRLSPFQRVKRVRRVYALTQSAQTPEEYRVPHKGRAHVLSTRPANNAPLQQKVTSSAMKSSSI